MDLGAGVLVLSVILSLLWGKGKGGDGVIDLIVLVWEICIKEIFPSRVLTHELDFLLALCLQKESGIFGQVGKLFLNPGKQTLIHSNMVV